MAWCEDNRADYVIGVAKNSRLVGKIGGELAKAQAEAVRHGRPARRFAEFLYTTLKSWSRRRRVVAKAEHLPGKANPRFVVTSLPADTFSARTVYERVYCPRGKMENTIKEQQLDLFSDRTSASRFDANQLRLLFSAFAVDPLRCPQALARGHPPGPRHRRNAPAQAPQDRRSRDGLGAEDQGGHGLRASVRRCLRTGPRPITRVTFHPLPTSSQARSLGTGAPHGHPGPFGYLNPPYTRLHPVHPRATLPPRSRYPSQTTPQTPLSGRSSEPCEKSGLAASSSRPTLQIGQLLGGEGVAFGKIADVVAAGDGSVFVVDVVNLTLYWFDPSGVLRDSTNGASSVTRPFVRPTSIDIGQDGRVFVHDRESRQIRSFETVNRELTALGSIPVPPGAESFCHVGSEYLVLVPDSIDALRWLDEGGRQLHSVPLPSEFAINEPAGFVATRRPWQSGSLVCDRRDSMIIFVATHVPMLVAFDRQGGVRWKATIEGYTEKVWEVTQGASGRTLVRTLPMSNHNVFHEVVDVVLLSSGRLAITLRELWARGTGSDLMHVRVFSTDGTETMRRPTEVTFVAANDSMLFAYSDVGVPQVLGWRMPGDRLTASGLR